MRCGMKNPRGLKVIRNDTNLVELNEYLTVSGGSKISDKFV